MKKILVTITGIFLIGLFIQGCQNSVEPTYGLDDSILELSDQQPQAASPASFLPPSPLVSVSIGSEQLHFWPFTGSNFSGDPQDPINLIFAGESDPRDLRAALLSLNGDRSSLGMPPIPPFNSTWDDAIGDVQTGYGEEISSSKVALSDSRPQCGNDPAKCHNLHGWVGSTIQLACGPYDGLRIHLRLFKIGQWTVANAHLDGLIPGTTDHQVLSWELAEQFVIADFVRSGLLDVTTPMIPTDQINPSPYRTIPAIIYNGLPADLRVLIGGPAGNVVQEVPINSDGRAMILILANRVSRIAETRTQDFVLNFDQVIPKPFCSDGPTDYVYVKGPVHLRQTAILSRSGHYEVGFVADGNLMVTPVNPINGQPAGQTISATVLERHTGDMTDNRFSASSMK